MRRKIVLSVFIIICFLLQCTLFKTIALASISPNILIILISSFGFMRGNKEGMYIGFFCGLLVDIFYGEVLGFYALVYMYIGYMNGHFKKIFYPEDVKLPIALITASELSYGLLIYFFLFLFRNRLDFLYFLGRVIIPELLYTIVLTIVIYPLVLIVNRKLEQAEKRSAGKFV